MDRPDGVDHALQLFAWLWTGRRSHRAKNHFQDGPHSLYGGSGLGGILRNLCSLARFSVCHGARFGDGGPNGRGDHSLRARPCSTSAGSGSAGGFHRIGQDDWTDNRRGYSSTVGLASSVSCQLSFWSRHLCDYVLDLWRQGGTSQSLGRLFGCAFISSRLSFVADRPDRRGPSGVGCLEHRFLACLGGSWNRQFRLARAACRSATDEFPLFQEHSVCQIHVVASSCDVDVLPRCHLWSYLLA